MPFALISGGVIGISLKLEESKRAEREEWAQMQEFKDELEVNAI